MNGNVNFEDEQEYLRIGTTYYRKIKKPLAGDSAEVDHPIPLEADQGFRWKLTR